MSNRSHPAASTTPTQSGSKRGERKLWIALALILVSTFLILGFFGREVYRHAPPIPATVVSESGTTLMTRQDILDGQKVWQSIGGQQVGSIWGHGAYQAPDWSAEWVHLEALFLLDRIAKESSADGYASLDPEQQARARYLIQEELRTNRFDGETDTLTISDTRAAAFRSIGSHYAALFGDDPELAQARDDYAIPDNAIVDEKRRAQLGKFFFWTAWACVTERPGENVTYTNNWPHEPLVGNTPSSANLLWSILSVLLLVVGIGALVWYQAFRHREEEPPLPPRADPLLSVQLTPSMRAVAKYVVVVAALLGLQCIMGAATAHYTVEGRAFFGFPLADYLPYSVTRTWHMQLALFWIATAFLAAGLFLGPLIGGREPPLQKLGVDILFGALLVVVLGSMAGQWFSVQQLIPLDLSFYLGHQGYEFVDLGRVWQVALFAGLVLWLALMLRALWPALRRSDDSRTITLLFTGSAAFIGLFYGAGFAYGSETHLSVMEYWRWWVVHLWVEGFMEVFTTAALAVIFSRLGLVRAKSAGAAVLFSTGIFLVGGIPGTFHHLYFSGTPVEIMAVGATFSALEVVPLVLIGIEAYSTAKMQVRAPWMERYKWPLRYFVAVAFWNMVGAGFFGFLINPPIALYFMQGLNTTAVHSHGALFGVYGFLALGLLLLVQRRLFPQAVWNEKLLAVTFWSFNAGLSLMVLFSLLPIGLFQVWASLEHGFWYARSAEFLQQPHLQTLRWLRIVGDTLFLVGVVGYVGHIAGTIAKRRGPVRSLPDVAPMPAE